MTASLFWKLGSLFGTTAIVTGSYGSHGLKTRLEKQENAERLRQSWMTGAHMHLTHSLALLLTSLKLHLIPQTASLLPGYLFAAGITLFSGSIYLLVLDKHKKYSKILGPITPIGGLCLMAGWASLALL